MIVSSRKAKPETAFEDRVFAAAAYFRLHRFSDAGRDSLKTDDFLEAVAQAEAAQREGYRVLLYVVSGGGHSALLPQARWRNFARIWQARRPQCALCGKPYSGHGNNAAPLAEGRCCDTCNGEKVIPARLRVAGL